MKSQSDTLAELSPNHRNPREEEAFEALVVFLEAIGGVEGLVISDEMILNDIEFAAGRWGGFESDFVAQVPSRTRRALLLKRAKRAALRRYFQEFVDEIAERKKELDELDDDERSKLADVETIEWNLANYIPEFIGRPATFRRDHAWLLSPGRLFFGQPLSPHYVRHWTRELLAAAGLTNHSVVYFVSLDIPERVKIGFTSNFVIRLRAFCTASSVEPTVHLTLSGGKALEDELHQRFAPDNIVREWFHLTPAIRAFIEEKKRGDS